MFGRATIRLGIGPHSSVNLECRSETCCARLAGNTGRKKVAKYRHLGTIAQLCLAIYSQLRHISTIGKNVLSSNMSSTCSRDMVNFGLLAAEIVDQFGVPCKFQLVSRLGSITTARHRVVGVSQTLRR